MELLIAGIVTLVFAALVTLWVLAVTRWKKWSGGCGSCQMLHDQGSCCQDNEEPDRCSQ